MGTLLDKLKKLPLYDVIAGTAKFVKKHPYISAGAIAVPYVSLKTLPNIATHFHAISDINTQAEQNKILNKQIEILRQIADKEENKTKKNRSGYINPNKVNVGYQDNKLIKKKRVFY